MVPRLYVFRLKWDAGRGLTGVVARSEDDARALLAAHQMESGRELSDRPFDVQWAAELVAERLPGFDATLPGLWGGVAFDCTEPG
jgi:hypothetical protein